jgi:small neutral amino acid transporter SnatA (MarC family)
VGSQGCDLVVIYIPVQAARLGERGLTAMELLMCVPLVTVAVQMLLDGVNAFICGD